MHRRWTPRGLSGFAIVCPCCMLIRNCDYSWASCGNGECASLLAGLASGVFPLGIVFSWRLLWSHQRWDYEYWQHGEPRYWPLCSCPSSGLESMVVLYFETSSGRYLVATRRLHSLVSVSNPLVCVLDSSLSILVVVFIARLQFCSV